MAKGSFDPGNPYGQGQPTPRIRWAVILVPLAVLSLIGGIWWLRQGHSTPSASQAPISSALQDTGGSWTPIVEKTRYEPEPVNVVPDETAIALEQMRKQMALMEKGRALDRERMQQQIVGLERSLAEERAKKAAAAEGSKGQKKQPKHQSMLFQEYKIDETKFQQNSTTYTLLPWMTKIPCAVETEINSDVESIFTAKVTSQVYDSETGQHVLIPQNATIGGKYKSKGLLYGNTRLDSVALELTIPSGNPDVKGQVIDLGEIPFLDQAGTAGLGSEVDQHFWRLFGAVFINSALKGSTQTIRYGSPGGAAAGAMVDSMTGGVNQMGQIVTKPYIDSRPTILEHAGRLCTIILTKELQLAEYRH